MKRNASTNKKTGDPAIRTEEVFCGDVGLHSAERDQSDTENQVKKVYCVENIFSASWWIP